MPSTGRLLILGSVTDLPATEFLPCLRSIRRAAPDATLVLFVGRMSDPDRAALEEAASQLIDLDSRYTSLMGQLLGRWLRRLEFTRGRGRLFNCAYRAAGIVTSAAGRRHEDAFSFAVNGAQSYRYREYLEYLTRCGDNFDNVMISDIRDVLFQSHPLDRPLEELEVFMEDPGVTLGQPGWNRWWYCQVYGEGALRGLENQVVSCSGITIGPLVAMTAYLAAMADEIEKHRRLPLLGHDQAIHNRLVVSGQVACRRIPNGTGRVLTMGMMRHVPFNGTTVTQANGSVPAVLHQYDRHPHLADQLVPLLSE